MKTTPFPLLARLAAVGVLLSPLSSFGSDFGNPEKTKELGLVRLVLPDFPPVTRVDGLTEGVVTIAYRRTPEGEPRDVIVLEATHHRLGRSASEAVQAWRFQPTTDPAELEARAVRFLMRVEGVVVLPYGRMLKDIMEQDNRWAELLKPVSVPQVQQLAKAPKVIRQKMPGYPASLSGQKVEGTAAVRFYIDPDGHVRLPEVVGATVPEFGQAAVAAVSQWRYESPKVGARRVVASDVWEFQFKANN